MRTNLPLILISFLTTIFIFPFTTSAQEWRENMNNLIYSPRYFGPNAFPIPEVRAGMIPDKTEIELRGEYHYYTGDKTYDLFGRILVPICKGKAGFEVSYYIKEKYELTTETKEERHTADVKSPIRYNGDVIVSSFYQILRSEKWMDILISANIKTASGGRLVDARYTDAVTYWFDLNLGRNIWKDEYNDAYLRLQAVIGFYCWMTNNMVHRQNDAISYGGGITGKYRNFKLSVDLGGFNGYIDNGDKPLILRNVLQYEYKNNIISLRYHHGMRDRLYETYGLAYTRIINLSL